MKRTAAGALAVAVYVRVSTTDQHLSQQFRMMREEAERRGWRIVRVFREKRSTRKDRPQLAAMLNAAARLEFGAVMVWRLDRLGRSLVELVANVERLNGRGVVALSVKDGALDTASASAKFQLSILAAVAEYERELIRERTREGMARVRARGSESGKPIGRPRADGAALAAAVADTRQLTLTGKREALPAIAARHGLSVSTLKREIARLKKGSPKTATAAV